MALELSFRRPDGYPAVDLPAFAARPAITPRRPVPRSPSSDDRPVARSANIFLPRFDQTIPRIGSGRLPSTPPVTWHLKPRHEGWLVRPETATSTLAGSSRPRTRSVLAASIVMSLGTPSLALGAPALGGSVDDPVATPAEPASPPTPAPTATPPVQTQALEPDAEPPKGRAMEAAGGVLIGVGGLAGLFYFPCAISPGGPECAWWAVSGLAMIGPGVALLVIGERRKQRYNRWFRQRMNLGQLSVSPVMNRGGWGRSAAVSFLRRRSSGRRPCRLVTTGDSRLGSAPETLVGRVARAQQKKGQSSATHRRERTAWLGFAARASVRIGPSTIANSGESSPGLRRH